MEPVVTEHVVEAGPGALGVESAEVTVRSAAMESRLPSRPSLVRADAVDVADVEADVTPAKAHTVTCPPVSHTAHERGEPGECDSLSQHAVTRGTPPPGGAHVETDVTPAEGHTATCPPAPHTPHERAEPDGSHPLLQHSMTRDTPPPEAELVETDALQLATADAEPAARVAEPGPPEEQQTSFQPSRSPPPSLIPRRFRRPPLLRSRTTQLSLIASPEMPIRKHYGRSMSMPATAGDEPFVPSFLSARALPEEAVQTIRTHYYPEGGWGWCVLLAAAALHSVLAGLQLAFGTMAPLVLRQFFTSQQRDACAAVCATGCLGAMSLGFSLLVSPVTIAVCRRKSTRLTAVLGGLVAALGVLFTSFASRFHQLFLSYGVVFAIGVSMTRDASTLMVGQYFKRRRELVETVVVSGSGIGLAVMSVFLQGTVGSVGWRLGLQAVTGVIFFTFLLGTFYRSASLYHPQRRAILHLKNSKKKVKGKNKLDDRPPFFDLSMLKSQTVRILLISASLSSVGLHAPLIYMARQAQLDGISDGSVLLLQTYLGLGWALGCWAFGFVVVRNNQECRISRQYLCQASSFLCGMCQLALPAVRGYTGYVLFAWLYGIFYGGYQYSLKMCTYERVRARNFAKTWGFVQGSQAIPMVIGVPVTGYINVAVGGKAGYYFSASFVVVGSISIFLMDLHRRRSGRARHHHRHGTSSSARTQPAQTPRTRVDSLPDVDERVLSLLKQRVAAVNSSNELRKQELTCISEEGIADMDLPDALFEDIELELNMLQGDITSCNKVENYLMLSEYENNLIAELPAGRLSSRRRSLVKQVSTMRTRAAQVLATKPADIPEEKSDIENDLASDTAVLPRPSRSTRLFRSLIRGKRKPDAEGGPPP